MSHDQRHRYEWKAIPWRTREGRVCKLQRRIYQATTRGETQKARRLQKLRATSWSAKSLAVRRVTQDNQGKKTAGVDGGKSLTPPQRLHLISHMDLHTPAKPVRRVWIDKSGKPEQRPLGSPIMQARATQALVKLAFEPAWEAQFEPTSFGCRPGRSSQDAVQQIGETIKIQGSLPCLRPAHHIDSKGLRSGIDLRRIPHKMLETPASHKEEPDAWILSVSKPGLHYQNSG